MQGPPSVAPGQLLEAGVPGLRSLEPLGPRLEIRDGAFQLGNPGVQPRCPVVLLLPTLTQLTLELFDAARAKGIQVIGEIYPYDYGASDILAPYLYPENYGRNMGRTYKDIIEISNLQPLTKERYEHLRETAPFTPIMFYNAQEEDVIKGLSLGADDYLRKPFEIRELEARIQSIIRRLEPAAEPLRIARGAIEIDEISVGTLDILRAPQVGLAGGSYLVVLRH